MTPFDEGDAARTERPTERRRREARARGQVARSAELVLSARLLATWGVVVWWATAFATSSAELLRVSLSRSGHELIQSESAMELVRRLATWSLSQVGTPLLIASGSILLAHFSQVGWDWQPQHLLPQLNRLSPLSGLSRLLSAATVSRGLIGFLKLSLVVTIGGKVIVDEWHHLINGAESELTGRLSAISTASARLLSSVAITLLAWGVADYFLQRWRFERSLRMTPEELRQEAKEVEGDPRIHQQRRAAARQILTEAANTPTT